MNFLLRTLAGRILGGVLTTSLLAGGFSFWHWGMDDATKKVLLSGTANILGWLMLVALIPWATFFVIGWVAKFNTNASGGALVLLYTALESVLLAWLFRWHVPGATAWVFFVVGTLFAGVYNLLVCDWIAERLEG